MPKEAVDAPSLQAFKARLDVALGSLVCWLATLHIAGGLKLHDHCGPFQPRPFYDSIVTMQTEYVISVLYTFNPKFHLLVLNTTLLPLSGRGGKDSMELRFFQGATWDLENHSGFLQVECFGVLRR